MRACERFLEYVKVHTTSDPSASCAPSSAIQFDLAHKLVDEMTALGLENAHVDEYGVVYGWLPATAGCEDKPALGFIAHMDTSPDYSGENVKPQIIKNYDGGDVVLAGTGDVLSVANFPTLKKLAGMTLITSDGTTLLCADDKAGIAAIVTAAERLMKENIPHGDVMVGFTPDEEIGRGADLFDIEYFGADYAYTCDGGPVEEIDYNNFNAAAADVVVTGVSAHPGSAKGAMVNAARIAAEYAAMLPELETPEHTEGEEGFYHMISIEGSCEHALVRYILRDHDAEKLEIKKYTILENAGKLNEKYGEGTVVATVKDSYRNMREIIEKHPEIVERAENAIRKAGGTPFSAPVRGGTDGATLSFMGLPCPNLGTGGENAHSRFEYCSVDDMLRMVDTIVYIASDLAE